MAAAVAAGGVVLRGIAGVGDLRRLGCRESVSSGAAGVPGVRGRGLKGWKVVSNTCPICRFSTGSFDQTSGQQNVSRREAWNTRQADFALQTSLALALSLERADNPPNERRNEALYVAHAKRFFWLASTAVCIFLVSDPPELFTSDPWKVTAFILASFCLILSLIYFVKHIIDGASECFDRAFELWRFLVLNCQRLIQTVSCTGRNSRSVASS